MNQIDPARVAARQAALTEQLAAKAALQHHRQHGHEPRAKAGWTSTLIVVGVFALAILTLIAMVLRA